MLDVGFTINLGSEFAAEISGMEYCVPNLLELESEGVQDIIKDKDAVKPSSAKGTFRKKKQK